MASNTGKFDALPGEAALYNLLPKGYALLTMLAAGIGGATWGWFQIDANAAALEKLVPQIEQTSKTTTEIQSDQRLMKQKLDDYLENEKERRRIQEQRDADISRMLQTLIRNGRPPPPRERPR